MKPHERLITVASILCTAGSGGGAKSLLDRNNLGGSQRHAFVAQTALPTVPSTLSPPRSVI